MALAYLFRHPLTLYTPSTDMAISARMVCFPSEKIALVPVAQALTMGAAFAPQMPIVLSGESAETASNLKLDSGTQGVKAEVSDGILTWAIFNSGGEPGPRTKNELLSYLFPHCRVPSYAPVEAIRYREDVGSVANALFIRVAQSLIEWNDGLYAFHGPSVAGYYGIGAFEEYNRISSEAVSKRQIKAPISSLELIAEGVKSNDPLRLQESAQIAAQLLQNPKQRKRKNV